MLKYKYLIVKEELKLFIFKVRKFWFQIISWSHYHHYFYSINLFILQFLFSYFLLFLYWSVIASQWCVSFCFITKWISYTYTYIPISPPSWVSLPPTLPIPPLYVVTKHRADLPVLCGCFPLAIYFTFGSVYMSMPLSLCHSLTFPLPISPSPFSGRSASLFPSCP